MFHCDVCQFTCSVLFWAKNVLQYISLNFPRMTLFLCHHTFQLLKATKGFRLFQCSAKFTCLILKPSISSFRQFNFQLYTLTSSFSSNIFQLLQAKTVQLSILPVLHFSFQVCQRCSEIHLRFHDFCIFSNALIFISAVSAHMHFIQEMHSLVIYHLCI